MHEAERRPSEYRKPRSMRSRVQRRGILYTASQAASAPRALRGRRVRHVQFSVYVALRDFHFASAGAERTCDQNSVILNRTLSRLDTPYGSGTAVDSRGGTGRFRLDKDIKRKCYRVALPTRTRGRSRTRVRAHPPTRGLNSGIIYITVTYRRGWPIAILDGTGAAHITMAAHTQSHA